MKLTKRAHQKLIIDLMKSQKLPMNESLLALFALAGIGCKKESIINEVPIKLCALKNLNIDANKLIAAAPGDAHSRQGLNTPIYKEFIRPDNGEDTGDFIHYEVISNKGMHAYGEYGQTDNIVFAKKIHCLAKQIVIPHIATEGFRIYATVGQGTEEVASKSSYWNCAHNYALMAEKKLELPMEDLYGAAKFQGEEQEYNIQPMPSKNPNFQRLSEKEVLEKYADIFEQTPITLDVYYTLSEYHKMPYKDYMNQGSVYKVSENSLLGYGDFDARAVFIPRYKHQDTNFLANFDPDSFINATFDFGTFGYDYDADATYDIESGHDDIPAQPGPLN